MRNHKRALAYAKKYAAFDDDFVPSKTKKMSCYHGHQPMALPGMTAVIHGGSCLNPTIDDADIYIGFDRGMNLKGTGRPWDNKHELLFPITDQSAPKSVTQFKALIGWTLEAIKAGQKVHCGCIGGHGRTGTFLAAMVATVAPDTPDAIGYVREHYCPKAVESQTQVKFLQQHFGVKSAAPRHVYAPVPSVRSMVEDAAPLLPLIEPDEKVFDPIGYGKIW